MGASQEQGPEERQRVLPLAVPRYLRRILRSLPKRDLHESRRQDTPDPDAQVPAPVQLHEEGCDVNSRVREIFHDGNDNCAVGRHAVVNCYNCSICFLTR